MSETVIRVRHLSYAYGEGKLRRQVLFDLQGEIRESEIVIVKGPSGPPRKMLLISIMHDIEIYFLDTQGFRRQTLHFVR